MNRWSNGHHATGKDPRLARPSRPSRPHLPTLDTRLKDVLTVERATHQDPVDSDEILSRREQIYKTS